MTKHSLPLASDAAPAKRPWYAMVLLSGGLDSVAALHWALERYDGVGAISVGYGQVNRDAELAAAGRVADRRGIHLQRLETADAVRGLGLLVAPPPGRDGNVSRANLACRNPILISIAAAEACRVWLGQRVDIVIGATVDDAPGFPDCRSEFVDAMSRAVMFGSLGVADLQVRAPWAQLHKQNVLAWCTHRPDALADVQDSVSCYRGTRCGECDACTLRAKAFALCGLTDQGPGAVVMHGGDPSREHP
jgi:7-cyano-7-deazaguanine synthase